MAKNHDDRQLDITGVMGVFGGGYAVYETIVENKGKLVKALKRYPEDISRDWEK